MNKKNLRHATVSDILELVGTGVLVAIALTSPTGGAKIVKHYSLKLIDKVWKKYSPRQLKQSVNRLIDRKLLEIRQVGEDTVVVISEKGKRELLRYNIDKMAIHKPEVWDGKWRVVIFDVLEGKRGFRDALRRKIKQLELFQLQKSVYVTPYPCEKEIGFIRQYYQVGSEVSVFTAVNLEEEDALKKYFGLK